MVWLKVMDAAKELSVHRETIKRWIKDGKLAAVKTSDNGNWRISREELDRFMAERAARRKEDDHGE